MMTHFIVVVMLLVSLSLAAINNNEQTPGTPTSQTCRVDSDCSDQGHWCRSGQYCLNRRCYRLNTYPCKPSQFCMEREKQCVDSLPCVRNEDCDNGLYCDGAEQCFGGKCRNNYRFFCVVCSEVNKTCPGGDMGGGSRGATITNNRPGVQTTSPTAAPTVPTAAPTTNTTTGLNEQQLWMIGFIMAAGVAIVIFFFYIITAAARPATPTSVVFITQTLDGDDGDDSQGNARQLLSAQAYQQKIHYK